MGQAISAIRDTLNSVDDEANQKAKQDLDVLKQLCDSHLREFESKLDAKFLNPEATRKIEVPGIRALRRTRYQNVVTKSASSGEISGAVDDFFNIGNDGVKTGEAVKGGFKKLVTAGLKTFTENNEVGQHTEEKYFIYMMHNAVVRLDVMLWRWNFTGSGFSDKYQSALGYVVCTSIVDVASLRTSEFVFLLSEYAGEGEDVVEYTKKMERIYDVARRMKLNQTPKEKPRPAEELVDRLD